MTSFELWLIGLGGRSSGLVLAALTLVVIARSLGPVGSGQYYVFVALIVVLGTVADLGVSQSALVFAGQGDVPLESVHRVLVIVTLTAATVVALVATGAIQLFGDVFLAGVPREWGFAALALLPLKVYANLWTAMMFGARRIVEVNAIQLAMNVLLLAANLAFVVTTGSALLAVAVFAAILVVQAVAMFVVAARMRSSAAGSAVPHIGQLTRDMVIFGVRGYPNSVSTLLWSRAVIFVLNAFHGPGAVGIYSISQQVAEKSLIPIQAIQDLTYARMARLPRPDATASLNRFLRIGIAAIVPTLIVAIVISPIFVPLLFSESFRGSALPLQILLAGSAVQAIPVLLATYFLAQLRAPALLSLLAFANAALNIVLLFLLVPTGAETGAALAMLVTQIVGTLIVFALYVRLGRTDVASALIVRREDFALLRQQASGLIRR